MVPSKTCFPLQSSGFQGLCEFSVGSKVHVGSFQSENLLGGRPIAKSGEAMSIIGPYCISDYSGIDGHQARRGTPRGVRIFGLVQGAPHWFGQSSAFTLPGATLITFH